MSPSTSPGIALWKFGQTKNSEAVVLSSIKKSGSRQCAELLSSRKTYNIAVFVSWWSSVIALNRALVHHPHCTEVIIKRYPALSSDVCHVAPGMIYSNKLLTEGSLYRWTNSKGFKSLFEYFEPQNRVQVPPPLILLQAQEASFTLLSHNQHIPLSFYKHLYVLWK